MEFFSDYGPFFDVFELVEEFVGASILAAFEADSQRFFLIFREFIDFDRPFQKMIKEEKSTENVL